MNILYISQYFPPEIGATQVRAKENVLHLRDFGHSVTVLTEMPNHPKGIISPGYKNKWIVREIWRGIPILRVWVFTRPEKTFFSRLLFYISFMAMAIIAALLFLKKRYHVVYATSPPFFVGYAGLILHYFYGAKFVFEVRDLWPQSAVELGELTNQSAIRLAQRAENFFYNKSDLIVAVTKGIFETIKAKARNKVLFLPNGANTATFRPGRPIPAHVQDQFHEKFVVCYTGVIGLIHGVENIVAAADVLRDHDEIHFLIIGDGVRKQEIEELAQSLGLLNITFMDAVQEEDLIPYILISQIAVATAKKIPITRGTLPVKMFSAMSCQVPVVLAIEGEGAELLISAKAGLVVQPDNPTALAQAILCLYQNPNLAQEFGNNGRAFVKRYFDRRLLALKLARELQKVAQYE